MRKNRYSYFYLNIPPAFDRCIRVWQGWPLLFFLFLFSIRFTFAQINPTTNSQLPNTDTLLMGSEFNYLPYSIMDDNGEATGFSVDLFRAAAHAAGMEIKPVFGLWADVMKNLADGEIDALPLVGRTPEREKLFDFSMAYLSLDGAVFVRKGENRIKSVNDLKGKEIMVMKNDNAEEFVLGENISDKIFTTTTVQEAFLNLENGLHDAVMIQHITGLEVLNELGIKSIEALDLHIPDFRIDYCFAVKKGNADLLARLNDGLAIVIKNGTYRDIYYKWFGPGYYRTKNLINITKTVLFILIPIVFLMVLLWIFLLRRQVKKRTRGLNEEIEKHKNTLSALEKQQQKLRKSEEQIRLLLNSTAEGIYAIDTMGNCTMINQSARTILGYPSQEEILGKNMHQLIHHSRVDGSNFEIDTCAIFKAFKNGTREQRDDEVFWKADGTSFPAEYFSYPIRENGMVTGSVVTFWDITERRKAESELIRLKNQLKAEVDQRTAELADKVQKLDRSQRAMLYMVEDLNQITKELKQERTNLERANAELEAFTYSVSHDLRAPLRAINGYARFLTEDYANRLDDEGKRFIQTIGENAHKMDKLIIDLLNLSRLSRSSINQTFTNMKQLALASWQETVTNQEKQSFDFILHDLPPAYCDASLTKQVWQNLIGNALKYSSKSSTKQIEIGAIRQDNQVIYYVKDSGIGFNEKFSEKIFGVFQRLHTETEFPGTGVGLAIVQRIVTRQGGKTWATGSPGKGATFYFTLLKTET
ncbi:MAG: transporter substrate-binding domain-containing protein [Mariniphaga sp.]